MNNISNSLQQFLEQSLADKNISALDKSILLKNVIDSEKLSADAENAKKPQPKEASKLILSTLAPLITAIALIATLWFQINQSKENSKNQIQAAEDVAWREMLKGVGNKNAGENLTLPSLIKSFYSSKKYGDQAREISVLFLSNTVDRNYFKLLFRDIMRNTNWDNFGLLVTLSNLLVKHYDEAKRHSDSGAVNEFGEELFLVGEGITGILKSNDVNRPKIIDLTGVLFSHQILDSANLSGAILEGTQFTYCSVLNANLTNVTGFDDAWEGSFWEGTAWWRSKQIDPELLSYLVKTYPKNDSPTYWQSSKDKIDYYTKDSLEYSNLIKHK